MLKCMGSNVIHHFHLMDVDWLIFTAFCFLDMISMRHKCLSFISAGCILFISRGYSNAWLRITTCRRSAPHWFLLIRRPLRTFLSLLSSRAQWPCCLLLSIWPWRRTLTATPWGDTAGLQTYWIMSTWSPLRYTLGERRWINKDGHETLSLFFVTCRESSVRLPLLIFFSHLPTLPPRLWLFGVLKQKWTFPLISVITVQ